MDEHETIPCPYCHEPCVRDWAPAAGGLARTGAFACTSCGAEEITHRGIDTRGTVVFEPIESRTGWFLPRI